MFIEPYLQCVSFGNLINIFSYSIDYKLVLTLLERWRPKIHKFHLSTSEYTVTLEDVYMLLDVRIQSKAANVKVNQDYAIYQELLGVNLFEET